MATANAPESKLLDPQTAPEHEGRYEVVDGQVQENALYSQLTEEPEGLYEVVDGEVRQRPEMWAYAAALSSKLMTDLHKFGQSDRPGRAFAHMLYLLDPEANLQRRPNVSFISAKRWTLKRQDLRGKWALEIVPDLAVEIISPSNRTGDDILKIHEYFQAGVKQVWMILPSVDQIYVYHSPREIQILGRGDTLEGGSVVPGFQVELIEFFGEP